MARPRGARDADHDSKRRQLVTLIRQRLAAVGETKPSLRQLAEAAGVTVPTLRHYFGSREEVIGAVLLDWRREGEPHLAFSKLPLDDVTASVNECVRNLVLGFRDFGVGTILAIGSIEGIFHPQLGPQYLDLILEPTLQAIEARLAAHVERGDLVDCDPRLAAIMLVAPVALAVQHQRQLGGDVMRPLDIDRLGREVADTFLKSHLPRPTGEGS